MVEFAADFESSKEVVYKEKEKETFVYKIAENEKTKVKYLQSVPYIKRKIDKQKSKTWVYLWGIETLDLQDYHVGYDIKSFIDFILSYPEDMKIYFHNLKFDSSFILYNFLQNTEKFKQLIPEINKASYDFNKYTTEENDHIFEYVDDTKSMSMDRYFKMIGYIDNDKNCTITKTFYQSSVNGMGVFYSLKIYHMVEGYPLHKVEIYDSLKLLNFSIKKLGTSFLNENNFEKEEYDYEVVRKENCPNELTDKDYSYLKRDIDILAKSLKLFKESSDIEGSVDKNTIASLALDEFKTILYQKVRRKANPTNRQKENVFRQLCPILSKRVDDFVRSSYKGGFCYVHPKVQNKVNEREGMCVLDVNSLFPYIMQSKPVPYGKPKHSFEVKKTKDGRIVVPYVDGEVYDYYFLRVVVNFKLKPNKIPSIMLKNADMKNEFNDKFMADLPLNTYLDSSGGQPIELIMSKDDYELMHEQYYVNENIVEGMFFKSVEGIFEDYINKWSKIKIEAGLKKDKTRREIAKLFLNSLYGKFGSKCENVFKFYDMDENVLTLKPQVKKIDDPIYVPMASAITAGARRKTIETSQKVLDYGLKYYKKVMYYYSDTDSIHTRLTLNECIRCLGSDIDKDNTGILGLWKAEAKDVKRSKFIRPKTYLEESESEGMLTGVAGMPKEIQELLNWDSFSTGKQFLGKLAPCHVQGGILLLEDIFTVKEV